MDKKEMRKKWDTKYNDTHPWYRFKRVIASRCKLNPGYNGERKFVRNIINTQELKELWFRDEAYKLKQPSVDRVDNDGNYTYENCRFIEQRENASKGNKLTKE